MLDISTFYNSLYKLAFIIPLSTNKITYIEDIFPSDKKYIYFIRNSYIDRFYFNDIQEIQGFLNQLENNKAYIITLDFVIS